MGFRKKNAKRSDNRCSAKVIMGKPAVVVIGTGFQEFFIHHEALPRCEQSHRQSTHCRYIYIAGYC